MQIYITPKNKISVAIKKLSSSLEDALLSFALWITNYWQPSFLMEWIDRYTRRRIAQLQRDQVKNNWRAVGLQAAVKKIREKQSQ